MTKLTSSQLLADARATIQHISVEEAIALHAASRAVFVDIRDSKELESGAIPRAVHAPRGGLEFALDPTTDLSVPELVAGVQLVMVCGSGGRAALATKLALDMGHDAVCLEGGFRGWQSSGAPVE